MSLNTSDSSVIVDPIFMHEVDQLVRAKSAFLNLAMTPPFVSRRTINLQKITAGPTLGWVREQQVKPESTVSFGRDTAKVYELAGICTWSDRLEAESFADPGIRTQVQRELANAAAEQIDSALFQGQADTDDTQPVGLLEQSGFQEVAVGDGGSDLGEDLRFMLRKAREQNFEPSAFVCHSTVLDGLLAIRTNDDQLKFPSVNSPSPTIWGKPIITCNNIDTTTVTDGVSSDVVLADWRRVLVFQMRGEVMVSNVATVGGLSMFERDSTAIRFVANVSSPIVQRPNSVTILRDAVA